MSSVYPKLPGYSINHDLTKTDFKKISGNQLERINNGEIKPKQNYYLPRQNQAEQINPRNEQSLSSSQQTFINHFDKEIVEQFQPEYVKYDKQVLRFYGYYKESVVESKREHARIRKLVIFYYLVDNTISISEEKEMNSGIVQGVFLARAKVKKDDYSYYSAKDLVVGSDIYVHGKFIRLYDCDTYTREFYQGEGFDQPQNQEIPVDNFHESLNNNYVPKKDNLMKDYLEHRLGGGRVAPQKQFLENDRKVLRFNAKYDSLKYIIHYYLADDTVEIRELHNHNR